MDLSARVLHEAEFREAKRGYHTQDVDEFLERLAIAVDRQDAALREARQRMAAAEHRAADLERRLDESQRGGGESTEADETLKRTLVLAQRTADAAIREAEERAARTVAAAEDEAARLLAEAQEASAQAYADAEEEARRAQHAARTRVLQELQELEATRELLRGDVELLERHVEEQRDRLRFSIRELQAIVDDPAALREVPVPQMAAVAVPEPEPEPEPERSYERPHRGERPGGRLVAPPLEAVGDEDDEGWPGVEDDYGPVETPKPRARSGPRPAADDVRQAATEDEYLTELRKAMTDDRPLGPRDEDDQDDEDDGGDARAATRSRFGRRR
jgi:DivIVA domain-containing protein